AALADLGRFDEAIGFLRTHPQRERVGRPHDLRVWYAAGDILERAGRPREAAAEFRRVLRHDAGAFDVAERLARLDEARSVTVAASRTTSAHRRSRRSARSHRPCTSSTGP